jgi:hypothetical protein
VRVALGLKAHSGWAALLAIAHEGADRFTVVDRRRIELLEDADADWAGQPYHAAQDRPADKARAIIAKGIAEVHRAARRELRAAVERMHEASHKIAACAVLTPAPLPDWSTAQILAVHIRMHQAEGALYPRELIEAARYCELRVRAIEQKQLQVHAEQELGLRADAITKKLEALGKPLGAPWGADQKAAALGAMIVLTGSSAKSKARS